MIDNLRYLFYTIVLVAQSLFSQPHYFVGGNWGYFIQHSENKNPITRNIELKNSYGLNLGVEYPLNKNRYFQIEFGRFTSEIGENIIGASEDGQPLHIGTWSLREVTFPLEVRLFWSNKKMTGYGYGLTLTNTNHYYIRESSYYTFEDIFHSTGVGINWTARFSKKIGEDLYLLSNITMRYINAVKFYGRGRDFSNFKHNYLQICLSLGLGK